MWESDSPRPIAPLSARERAALAVVLPVAALALFLGWRLFWFQCDDAYIAYRYVSNAHAGHGYTWNPPPFRPVEGYTSFLWVFLLDWVWRVTGYDPTVASNPMSLGFSYGSLGLISLLGLRARWPEAVAPYRVAITAAMLLGTLSNRTFLAWTTSGLETACFSFLVLSWVTLGLLAEPGRRTLGGLTTLAALITLCRPDGLLFVAATGLYWALWAGWTWRAGRLRPPDALPLLAFLVPLAHLVWRFRVYGAWLPNTWYAKAVGAWPASGIRYFASFALEYAVWFTALVALVVAGAALVRAARGARFEVGPRWLMRVMVVSTVLTQFSYYTFRVGGDHFEYRVYHHLVPLLLLALPWLWGQLGRAPRLVVGVMLLQIALATPIPWLHWSLTHELNTRELTHRMRVPVAPHLPTQIRWYGTAFDKLQDWLIVHFVGMRHQEHKIFAEHQLWIYPSREDALKLNTGPLPVMIRGAVGVPGWNLPNIYIVDRLGLNDFVVARNPVPAAKARRMAHDRRAPKGYTECFRPNVDPLSNHRVRIRPRKEPLTAEQVKACEKRFAGVVRYLQRVERGEVPPPKKAPAKPKPPAAPPPAPDAAKAPGPAGMRAPAPPGALPKKSPALP
jgi:arabinofuranosyltransferase